MGFRDYESSFLGGLRAIELPLSVLALSTQVAYKVTLSYEADCKRETNYKTHGYYALDFPFSAENLSIPQDLCTTNVQHPTVPLVLNKDHSPEAIAFLVVSVMAVVHFLISFIVFLLYWFNMISARHRRKLIAVDFIITLILTVAWLASSIAWMIGTVRFVNEINKQSLHDQISGKVTPCNQQCGPGGSQSCCTYGYSDSVPIIYASPIAGLVMFIVCLIELPFLFKRSIFRKTTSRNVHWHETRPKRLEDSVWTSSKGYGGY